uniref:Uncharacterized protein n=1 Tax=Oryzias latipes TaxID=8090 RepID=A0A3P9KZR1_ORYLA
MLILRPFNILNVHLHHSPPLTKRHKSVTHTHSFPGAPFIPWPAHTGPSAQNFGHTVLSLDTQSFLRPHRTFNAKFGTHSPFVGHTVLPSSTQDDLTQNFGHTVLSLDTQSFLWTHSPFFGHTVLSLDTKSFLWTHSPFFGHTVLSLDTHPFVGHTVLPSSTQDDLTQNFGHTVLSLDTQSFLWTHSPFFGHTVLSLDTKSFLWTHSPFFGHTVLSLDTQSFLWTHSPFFVHTGRLFSLHFLALTLKSKHTPETLLLLSSWLNAVKHSPH